MCTFKWFKDLMAAISVLIPSFSMTLRDERRYIWQDGRFTHVTVHVRFWISTHGQDRGRLTSEKIKRFGGLFPSQTEISLSRSTDLNPCKGYVIDPTENLQSSIVNSWELQFEGTRTSVDPYKYQWEFRNKANMISNYINSMSN